MTEIDKKDQFFPTELSQIGQKLFERTMDILRKSDDFKNSLFEHFAVGSLRYEEPGSLRISFMGHGKYYEVLRMTTDYIDTLHITKRDKHSKEKVSVELVYLNRGRGTERKVQQAIMGFEVSGPGFRSFWNREAAERAGKFLDVLENG